MAKQARTVYYFDLQIRCTQRSEQIRTRPYTSVRREKSLHVLQARPGHPEASQRATGRIFRRTAHPSAATATRSGGYLSICTPATRRNHPLHAARGAPRDAAGHFSRRWQFRTVIRVRQGGVGAAGERSRVQGGMGAPCWGMRRGLPEPRRPIAEGVQGALCAGATTWGDGGIGGATSKGLRVRPSATTTQPTHARRVAFMKSSAAFLACGLAAAYNMAELPRCAK